MKYGRKPYNIDRHPYRKQGTNPSIRYGSRNGTAVHGCTGCGKCAAALTVHGFGTHRRQHAARGLQGLLCTRWKSLARGIAGARLLVEGCFAGWLAYLDRVLVLELLEARCHFHCNAACCMMACAFVCSWTRAPGRAGTSHVALSLGL